MILRSEQDKERVIARITKLNLEKPWLIEGKIYEPEKTDSQRGLFHVLARELAQQIGETEGAVKMMAKAKLCGTRQVTMRGIEITVPDSPSSERYSKKQYTELIEILYWLAGETGVSIGEGF